MKILLFAGGRKPSVAWEKRRASVLRMQRAISTLHAIAAKQRERDGSIAAATQADGPDAEPAKPDGYGEEAIRILKEMPPPPKRPGHHVVIDPEPAPAPAPPPPVDPPKPNAQHYTTRPSGRAALEQDGAG